MSTLTPIFSIPFLLCLGISLILIGFVGVFFYQKITEQNHKISSMVDLISTMAEELNYIRSRVQSEGTYHNLPSSASQQIPFLNGQDKKPELIDVSDDESDDEEEDDDESEDESEDEGEESDEEEDDEDDIMENIKVINISETAVNPSEVSDEIEEIPSEESDTDDEDDLEDDDKSSIDEKETSEVEVIKLDEVMDEPQEFEPVLDVDANLLKSIHMSFPTSENVDYKKMSLNKLRQTVSDKKLSSDTSKLKKQDLLKLLGVE
jgi:hypothetical protein